jgi:hypothetical protein
MAALTRFVTAVSLAATAWLPTSASLGQPSESPAEFWTAPHEFYLYGFTNAESFDFDTERSVRICNGTVTADAQLRLDEGGAVTPEGAQQAVPLRVEHDDQVMMLSPGECTEFTARHVAVSPGDSLRQGWALRGTISTSDPAASSG